MKSEVYSNVVCKNPKEIYETRQIIMYMELKCTGNKTFSMNAV